MRLRHLQQKLPVFSASGQKSQSGRTGYKKCSEQRRWNCEIPDWGWRAGVIKNTGLRFLFYFIPFPSPTASSHPMFLPKTALDAMKRCVCGQFEYGVWNFYHEKASADFKCAGGAHEKVTASRLVMLLWKAMVNHYSSSLVQPSSQICKPCTYTSIFIGLRDYPQLSLLLLSCNSSLTERRKQDFRGFLFPSESLVSVLSGKVFFRSRLKSVGIPIHFLRTCLLTWNILDIFLSKTILLFHIFQEIADVFSFCSLLLQ